MKRRTVFSAFVTLLVAATAAMAYFFVAGLGEGEHTAELGKGTASNYPVAVSFADGLTPGAKRAGHADARTGDGYRRESHHAHESRGPSARDGRVRSEMVHGVIQQRGMERSPQRHKSVGENAGPHRGRERQLHRPPSRRARWNSPKRKPTSRRAKERTSRSRPSRPRKPENERSARRRRPLGGHERRRSPDDHEAKGATARRCRCRWRSPNRCRRSRVGSLRASSENSSRR